MFGIIKKKIIVLLTSILNASNHLKCVSLSNQKSVIKNQKVIKKSAYSN